MSFRSKAVTIAILAISMSIFVTWFGYTMINRVSQIERLWSRYNQDATVASYTLNQITTHFGYGGFIHNLKNYVLHQDPALIDKIDSDLKATYKAIDIYNSLNIDVDERSALKRLTHIIDVYAFKFKFIKKLVDDGITPRETEIHTQVNDEPALDAIAFLAKNALLRSKEKEQETHDAIQNTIAYLEFGMLLIPLFFLGAWLMNRFIRKIVNVNHELHNAHEYSESLLGASPDPTIIVSKEGIIESANAQSVVVFGYAKEKLIGMKVEELLPDHFRAAHARMRDGYFENPTYRPIGKGQELSAKAQDGRSFPVEISLSYVNKNGRMLAIASIRDITQRRKAEEQLRLTKQIFENTSEAILLTDANHVIVDMNRAFYSLMGYTREELIGKTLNLFIESEESVQQQKRHTALMDAGHWKGELWGRRQDGESSPSRVCINAVRDQRGRITHYVSVFSDISAIKANEERLELLAHFDQLTCLPNRLLFHDRLRNALGRAHRNQQMMAVLFIDLDGFKAVNDTLGHITGDQILAKAAALLGSCVREDDTVARIGGDEFSILANDLEDISVVEALAQRIVDITQISVPTINGTLHVSCSVGIAVYPRDGRDIDTLISHADHAMYSAKHAGKCNFRLYRQASG